MSTPPLRNIGLGLIAVALGQWGLSRVGSSYFLEFLAVLIFGTALLTVPLLRIRQNETSAYTATELLAVLLLCLAGLFFRVWQLDTFPPPNGVMSGDEAISGLLGWSVLTHPCCSLHPPVFTMAYPTALWFALTDISIYSLRAPFVLAGVITLPLFYPFARLFLDRRAALLALFLLAASRWHNIIGRMAIDWIHVPLLTMLCFHLFWRGVLCNWRYFVLHGFVLGIALVSYYALRIVFLIELLGLIWYLIRTPLSLRRRSLIVSAFLGFSALFAVAPLAALRANPTIQTHMASKYQHLTAQSPAELADFFAKRAIEVGASFWDRDRSAVINPRSRALVDRATIVYLLLGLVLLIPTTFRNPYHTFLGIWFVATVVAGGLLVDEYANHRLAGLLPLISIVSAYGITNTIDWILRTLVSRRQKLFLSTLIVMPLCAVVGFENWIQFQWSLEPSVIAREYRTWRTKLCASVGRRSTYVHDLSGYGCFDGDWRWLTKIDEGSSNSDHLSAIPHRGSEQDVIYALSTENFGISYAFFQSRAYLEEIYGDDLDSRETTVPDTDIRTIAAFVRREVLARRRKLTLDARGLWHGNLHIDSTSTYKIGLEIGAEFKIDNKHVLDGDIVKLLEGWHRIEIRSSSPPLESVRLNEKSLPLESIFSGEVASHVVETIYSDDRILSERLVPAFFGAFNFPTSEVGAVTGVNISGLNTVSCMSCRIRLDTTRMRGTLKINSRTVLNTSNGLGETSLSLTPGDRIEIQLSREGIESYGYQLLLDDGEGDWERVRPEAFPRSTNFVSGSRTP